MKLNDKKDDWKLWAVDLFIKIADKGITTNGKGILKMFDDLNSIYSIFKSLQNNKEKIEYLQQLKIQNPPYNINFDNLIKYYQK